MLNTLVTIAAYIFDAGLCIGAVLFIVGIFSHGR